MITVIDSLPCYLVYSHFHGEINAATTKTVAVAIVSPTTAHATHIHPCFCLLLYSLFLSARSFPTLSCHLYARRSRLVRTLSLFHVIFVAAFLNPRAPSCRLYTCRSCKMCTCRVFYLPVHGHRQSIPSSQTLYRNPFFLHNFPLPHHR